MTWSGRQSRVREPTVKYNILQFFYFYYVCLIAIFCFLIIFLKFCIWYPIVGTVSLPAPCSTARFRFSNLCWFRSNASNWPFKLLNIQFSNKLGGDINKFFVSKFDSQPTVFLKALFLTNSLSIYTYIYIYKYRYVYRFFR